MKPDIKKHLDRLDRPRTYAESNSTMALCHALTTTGSASKSNNFSAIHFYAETLNPVGEYFKAVKQNYSHLEWRGARCAPRQTAPAPPKVLAHTDTAFLLNAGKEQ
ncbi:hypothetical protein PDESU_03988 [Pontiella desulfatans]|uniref:Uncharacterized protein n=1 Tax=Pontiella desulfatans TaxID=2750659 RepID=A0A6C2U660_PONDE|nr:hypothetical protein [Pontiella desulfatans]VGO15405.1 hypothetical protein PDESU_03988 [Pontiella desulfatans]